MENVTPRVRVPSTASAGETVTIKTLISHPMESGQRKDAEGNTIPRHIINRFLVTFNDETVLDVDIDPAVSTNPYFEFEATIPETGTMTFTWFDDDGSEYTESAEITVS